MAVRYKTENKYKENAEHVLAANMHNAYYTPKLKTGCKSLDLDNYGGLNRSGPVLISGVSGSGKSTLVNQICSLNSGKRFFDPEMGKDGRPKKDSFGRPIGEWKTHHCAIVQGEAGKERVATTLYRQMAGELVENDMTPDGLDRFYVSEPVRDRIFNQVGEDTEFLTVPRGINNAWRYLQEMCEWIAENSDIDIWIFDNYTTICNNIMSRDDETRELSDNTKQSILAAWLEDFGLKYNVFVIVVAHVKKLNNGFAGANAMEKTSGSLNSSNLAGMVIDFEVAGDQRLVRVIKNREFGCNFEGYRTDFDMKSQRIYEEGDEKFLKHDFPWVELEKKAKQRDNGEDFFKTVQEASDGLFKGVK